MWRRRGVDEMNPVWSRSVRVVGPLVAIAAVLALPSAAAAQRISGTVREADGGRLISAGFVSLLDRSGAAVEADFTAAAGAFSFQAPGPGEYRIRVERIGYADWVTEPYAVAAGQALAITVDVPREPVRLGDLRVEVTGACLDDPRQGEALAVVWEEARKALETAVWAEDRGELTFTLTEFERTVDPRSLVTLGSETRTRRNVRPPPFRSLPARQLVPRVTPSWTGTPPCSMRRTRPSSCRRSSGMHTASACGATRWKARQDSESPSAPAAGAT